MDLERIKQKSCSQYLESKGLERDRKSSKRYSFFKSPFRNEKTASLCINESKNTWFDYGAGFGGDVIRLVEFCENVDFKEAYRIIDNSFFKEIKPKHHKSNLVINDVRELSNHNLLNYLAIERKINISLAEKYLKEVHFTLNNRNQYAIGFQNDKGGFELRNKFLKISTSPKWFSSIKGKGSFNVFEGFMDFLSLMTYYNLEPTENVIVLNSVSMIDKVKIDGDVKFWGDNDKAGDACFNKINARDMRFLYKPYKDINEFLCAVGRKNIITGNMHQPMKNTGT